MSTEMEPVNFTALVTDTDHGHSETSAKTEASVKGPGNKAAQANLQMEREFYGRDGDPDSAEAVDPAQIFRNQS